MRTQLGPFQILEVVGRGGMGTVYRGLDPLIGRPVAVKVIRLVGYNNAEERGWLRDRLFSEARAAGNLSHPGIVTIYQVGEANEVAYIAMEFVDGPSLQDILRDHGPVDRPRMCAILSEAATALDYAHEHGLVHRDIKPANIMVNSAGATKVTDFGIAKTMLGQTVTKTGVMIGTPYYMSPEQIRGKSLDGRSDQFSLAVVAYEIFTGRRPFVAEQVTSICYQILHEEPVGPDNLNPSIGPEIADVIRRGMAKDPDVRYSSCTEFASALAGAARKRVPKPVAVTPPKPAEAPAPKEHRKHFVRPAIYSALAVVCILAASKLAVTRESAPVRQEVTSPHAIEERPSREAPVSRVRSSEIRLPDPPQSRQRAERANRPAVPAALPKPEVRPGTREITAPRLAVQPLPRTSMLVWTGQAVRGDLVTIQDSRASAGAVAGGCPASASAFTLNPASWANGRLTVLTANARYGTSAIRATPRGPAMFTFDPRHATDLTLFEAAGSQNGGVRLVVRVNAPVAAFVVECAADQ
jgi:serine/threonine protein kinase